MDNYCPYRGGLWFVHQTLCIGGLVLTVILVAFVGALVVGM